MKALQYISTFCLSLLMLGACDSDLEKVTYNKDTAKAAKLQNIDAAYVLDVNKPDEIAITFNWENPDMGYQAEVTNTLEMGLKGLNFDGKVVLAATKTDKTYAIKVSELNNKIMGLLSDTEKEIAATDFEFRLASSIGAAAGSIYSNVITATITPYTGERDYPKVWLIGDYCGWNHTNSQFLFSFAENEVYEGVADFGEKAASGFKITGIAGWDDKCNWGTDGDKPAPEAEAASIQLITSGGSGNISCYSSRFYHFTFNTTTMLLKKDFSFNQLGVIGDGVGSWENDVVMKFDSAKQRFYADVEMSNGTIKFRADANWNTNWGGEDGLLSAGGNNINVTAGKYRIYVNLNNPTKLTYELNTNDFGK